MFPFPKISIFFLYYEILKFKIMLVFILVIEFRLSPLQFLIHNFLQNMDYNNFKKFIIYFR